MTAFTSKNIPHAVLQAYSRFLDVCAKNNVPLHALIESPSAQRVREAEDELAALKAQMERPSASTAAVPRVTRRPAPPPEPQPTPRARVIRRIAR